MDAPTAPSGRQLVLAALVLALLVGVAYGRALGFDFVYDDRTLIASNAALGDWSTLPEALGRDLFHFSDTRASPYWRPLVTASYYLEHALGGGAPWAFHLGNLAIAWAAGLGLFALLMRLGRSSLVSGAGAAAFLLHPLLVEPVANIASRTDLLCLALLLGSLLVRSGPAAALCTLGACGAKEVGVLAPLLGFSLQPRGRRGWWQAGAVALYLAARSLVLSQLELLPEDRPSPTAESALGAGARILWMLGRVFWPVPLSPSLELYLADGTGAALAWVLVLAMAALLLRRGPEGRLVAVLGLASLLPVSGLVSSAMRYGDGLLVLPVAGAVIGLAALLRRPLPLLGLALIGAVWGSARVGDWQDEAGLWRAAHARVPEDPGVRLNLARTIVEEDPAEALSLLQDQTLPDPRRERERREVLGRALLGLQRPDEALDELIAASSPDPEAAWASATACLLAGERAAQWAEEICAVAAQAASEDGAVWNSWGLLAAREGRFEQALQRFERACALDTRWCANRDRAAGDLERARGGLLERQ